MVFFVSVLKILLKMFILLSRKAFLEEASSCNLKLGWMCVLLVSVGLFGST